MTKMTFSERVDSIHRATSELAIQVAAMKLAAERVDALPRTTADVEALLFELAEAERDKCDHYKRHPLVRETAADESPYARAADPVACEADWDRVYRRRQAAIDALTRYALALSEVSRDSSSEVAS